MQKSLASAERVPKLFAVVTFCCASILSKGIRVQVADYSQRKLQEMNAVHVRFREVLQKKEDAHAVLRTQLQDAQGQIQHLQSLFEQQRCQLMQLTS